MPLVRLRDGASYHMYYLLVAATEQRLVTSYAGTQELAIDKNFLCGEFP